jgi:hypothetical protein
MGTPGLEPGPRWALSGEAIQQITDYLLNVGSWIKQQISAHNMMLV